jgi:uncharacterized protein
MHIARHLADIIQKTRKSVLLLGPRQTGKSTLIRSLKPDLEIDLADQQTYLDHLRDPSLVKQLVRSARRIFIDEIQRIPSLLNTVQSLIDHDPQLRFYLTGSSARKLKRGQANLLPGRVLSFRMGPLAWSELGDQGDLRRLLSVGALPGIYLEADEATARKTLRSYAATYLKEEIQAEALTRNLEGFSRYFDVLAAHSGSFVDFNKFSSLARIDRMSGRRYFDILVDTMIAWPLEAFTKSQARRLIQHPKFYFFDVGVLNACLGNFEASPDRKGLLFEHLCLQMITSELNARDQDFRISSYRTEAGAEVDFVLEKEGEVFALEVKATRNIGASDLRGLRSFASYYKKPHQSWILYLGENALEREGIEVLPWTDGIRKLT